MQPHEEKRSAEPERPERWVDGERLGDWVTLIVYLGFFCFDVGPNSGGVGISAGAALMISSPGTCCQVAALSVGLGGDFGITLLSSAATFQVYEAILFQVSVT